MKHRDWLKAVQYTGDETGAMDCIITLRALAGCILADDMGLGKTLQVGCPGVAAIG